jgi:WD40 repeat protein
MAEAPPGVQPQESGQRRPLEYDAFLSYAHRDKDVTSAIQKGLHQIGRRVGQLRALRVFRDDTNLTANPDLWAKITEALDGSRFMIVVLSPQSATSHWVNEEVSHWLEQRGHEGLMLVLAEGRLLWDEKDARFNPEQSDAAPPVLTQPGSLPVEPLYIDVSGDAPWELSSLVFRDKVTSLAAPIHGKPKDDLTGDDLREQRRFRRLRRAAVAGLVALTVISVVAAVVAVAQRQEAIQRLHDAVVAKLNAEGAAMLAGSTPGGDVRALQELLSANAIQRNGVPVLDAQIARFTTQKIVETSSAVHDLAYNSDGSRIATAQADGTVRQWESATGQLVGAPMKTHSDEFGVIGVTFTPNGHTIASASSDGMRLWNADTGAARVQNPAHRADLMTVAVSPDGKMVATGSNDGNIQTWDPHSGQLRATSHVFPARISDVTFDRSGNLLAASGLDGSIKIFDITTGELHAPIISVLGPDGNPAPAWRIAFSPDGHTIAAASNDLELFNADTGTSNRSIRVGATKVTVVSAVAFSPDGHRIATGRDDGALQLWDPDTGAQLGQTLTGHTGDVWSVAFRPDGRQIASASQDGTLRLWSATVGQPMRSPDQDVGQVAFSPDGQRVTAAGDTAVQQWDVSSGQPRPPLTPSGAGAKFFGFVDGGRIVIAATDGTVQVWDAETGQPASPPVHINIPSGHAKFAFSGDGREVATGEEDGGMIQLWDVATGRARGQPMTIAIRNTHLHGLVFSPDGHHLAAGYDDGLQLWNADTTQPEGTIMTNAGSIPISSVAFSRDGYTVAAGRGDGAVELWDSTTRKPLPKSPLVGEASQVFALAFGTGYQLASGGMDGSLRLWDTSTGKAAVPLTRSDSITGVALSPDGRLAATASADGTVLLWPALADYSQLCHKLTTNMSRKQWRDWVSPAIPYITVCPGLPVAPD